MGHALALFHLGADLREQRLANLVVATLAEAGRAVVVAPSEAGVGEIVEHTREFYRRLDPFGG
ncbi:hypothetical protein [Rhodococcus aetherivorans]|uniref:hypothetical protein n=1 Tax=Rhodococcus aetherivorans TaxID=191292 RepID=UPI00241F6384|nr:hypothetical protein [Rhodococcus aetherivorans]WFS11096.1 hypothetical protein P9K37_14820 [Rhodococcus aetherivorans]